MSGTTTTPVLGSDLPPRQAGMIRSGWGATIALVLNGLVVTLQQWQGLPSIIYVVWVPILYAVIRQVEAELDAHAAKGG